MAQPTVEVRDARRRLRALRLGLPRTQRRSSERAIAAKLRGLGLLRRGSRVAVYLPVRGEVDLSPLFEHARRSGATLYVPRITSRRRRDMEFVPLVKRDLLRANRYGILEPASTRGRRLRTGEFDVMLVPVVGFDRRGNRLGMGAGFYDRALRHRLKSTGGWRRPKLIGVAFAFQELPRVDPSPWDVPLDLVVTEAGVVVPRRSTAGVTGGDES
jgi:5-formyltetrahydrofolate cyclo-ligase